MIFRTGQHGDFGSRRTLAILVVALAMSTAALAGPTSTPMTPAQEEATVKGFELSMQGQQLFGAGRFAEAETIFREVLRLHVEAGSDPLSVASALHNVAASIASDGRPAEAEALARQALDLRQANSAVANAMASSQRLLASILNDLGQYAEARGLQEQAVLLALNGEGVDPATLVRSFTSLAYLTALDGDVNGGIELVNQLVPMLQQMAPHDVALTLNTIGRLLSMSGQPDQAEVYFREAASRSALIPAGPDWTIADKATVLNNFAAMLRQGGRVAEAEGLFLQADRLLTDAGLTRSDLRATILDGLGEVWRAMGRYKEAYGAEREALDIRLATLPQDHPSLGISFSNLGLVLLNDGQFEPAAQAFEKAVAIQTRAGDAIRAANARMNLAIARAALGQQPDAITLAAEARDGLAAALPEDHPLLVNAAFNLAWLDLAAGRNAEALDTARAAFASYRANSGRLGADETIGAAQARDSRRQVLSVVAALWETAGAEGLDEAFQAAQWAQASKASQVARRVAARFAAGDGALAELARQRQDLTNLWRAADAQYLARLSAAGEADPLTASLRAQVEDLSTRVSEADAKLATDFPDYTALTRPAAATLADIQSALRPDEALLMPVSTPDETYVFAVSTDQASWTRVAMTEAGIDAAVRRLRADLDPTGPSRSAQSLQSKSPTRAPFDAATALELYTTLVAPVTGVLDSHDTLYVVQEGALAGLPLSVLLTGPLDETAADPFRHAPWLIRRHAFVTLPSASALIAARGAANPRPPARAFAGFGDPDFAGLDTRDGSFKVAAQYTRSLGDTRSLAALPPLPGTRREILGLARDLAAGDDAVFLGPDATETHVRTSDAVREAQVVVFATHGLVAGDLTGLAEPALAFSAPTAPSGSDDGLLTASEAAGLDLAADWVILSACNTAAPDGTPGGEGLSGLASAFLYAGARSLMVSHWPVRDDAAGLLTRGALQAAADTPGLGNAAALRKAMLALIDEGFIPDASNPATWAPFVIVGANGN